MLCFEQRVRCLTRVVLRQLLLDVPKPRSHWLVKLFSVPFISRPRQRLSSISPSHILEARETKFSADW